MLEDYFSDIISKARFGLGLSLEQVAEAAGISAQRLEALERGEMPTQGECLALAQVLRLSPWALWQVACEEYKPVPLPGAGAGVRCLKVTRMRANAYLVSGIEDDALLVDPGGDANGLIHIAKTAGHTICGILLTHGHSDHSAAVADLTKALKAPVLASPYDYRAPGMVELSGDCRHEVGSFQVEAFACPGHTAGSYAFMINGRLFTGDTLFAGSLGRAASPKDYPQLLASGYRLLQAPAATPIFAGHGPATSVELEQRHNPFLATYFGDTQG